MILAALILQAAAPQGAVEAERAFNAAAQARGQWTAFREFAAADATMFVPQPVKAQAWLRDRKNPPRSVEWWPTESYVSCDGTLAVNTGGWRLPEGTVGYFSTVWRKQADGSWKWIVDGGDALATPRERPARPLVRQAVCTGTPPALTITPFGKGGGDRGQSADDTLRWRWDIDATGARRMYAVLWNGMGYDRVVSDQIGAPGK
jgi:hypothetical protein